MNIYTTRAILTGLALSLPYGAMADNSTTIDGSTNSNGYDSMSYRGDDTDKIYSPAGNGSNSTLIIDNKGTDAFNKRLAAGMQDGNYSADVSYTLRGNVVEFREGSLFDNNINAAYLQKAQGSVTDNIIRIYGGFDVPSSTSNPLPQFIAGHAYDTVGDATLLSNNKIIITLKENEVLTATIMGAFLSKGSGNVVGNSVEVTGGSFQGKNCKVQAAVHQGSLGTSANNHLTATGVNSAASFYASYRYGGSGESSGNTVTITNSKVGEVRAASHEQALGGKLTNNHVLLDNTCSSDAAHAVFLGIQKNAQPGQYSFEEVSGNTVTLQNGSTTQNELNVVQMSTTVNSAGVSTIGKVFDNVLILKDTSNGNHVNKNGDSRAISAYNTGKGLGEVKEAYNNSLVLSEDWTGEGNSTHSFAKNTLGEVEYFDNIDIEWSEGQSLTIENLTANPLAGDNELTFRINDIDTNVQVGAFTNEADKAVAVEATGRVRDQMGEGAELQGNLEKLAAVMSVSDGGTGYTTQYAESVKAAEGDIHGAVEAKVDARGKVDAGSIVRSENSVNHSLGSIAGTQYLAFRSQLNDLQKRLSALRATPGTKANGCWARAFSGKDKYSSLGSDYHYNGMQVGADRRFSNYIAGLAFGYTDAKTTRPNGRADDTQYSLGAYAGWQSKRGQFVDVTAKYTHMDSEHELHATNGQLSTSGQHTWGASIAAEYGWHLTIRNTRFYIEPHIGAMYGHLDGSSFVTSRGVRAKQADADSFIGKLGLTAGYNFARHNASVYARAELLRDWGGDTELTVSKAAASRSYNHSLSDTYGEFAIGGTCGLTEESYLFAELQSTLGSHLDQPWHINIGVSVGF